MQTLRIRSVLRASRTYFLIVPLLVLLALVAVGPGAPLAVQGADAKPGDAPGQAKNADAGQSASASGESTNVETQSAPKSKGNSASNSNGNSSSSKNNGNSASASSSQGNSASKGNGNSNANSASKDNGNSNANSASKDNANNASSASKGNGNSNANKSSNGNSASKGNAASKGNGNSASKSQSQSQGEGKAHAGNNGNNKGNSSGAVGPPARVDVCHVAGNGKLVFHKELPASAADAHARHGDTVGVGAESACADLDDGDNGGGDGNGPDRVGVCHETGSGKVIFLNLPEKAAEAHARHGDTIGGSAEDCTDGDGGNGNGPDRVGVCHETGSGKIIFLTLPETAAAAHARHGDVIGVDSIEDCVDASPEGPDGPDGPDDDDDDVDVRPESPIDCVGNLRVLVVNLEGDSVSGAAVSFRDVSATLASGDTTFGGVACGTFTVTLTDWPADAVPADGTTQAVDIEHRETDTVTFVLDDTRVLPRGPVDRDPSGAPAAGDASGPGSLAFTGMDSTVIAWLAVATILSGAVLVRSSRRRREAETGRA